jgi:hypothetical protein
VVFNHFRWLEEMEAKVDQVKAESKRDHFQQLGRVRDLTGEVAEVRNSTFNPAGLEGEIADLRTEVQFLKGTDDDIFQLLP